MFNRSINKFAWMGELGSSLSGKYGIKNTDKTFYLSTFFNLKRIRSAGKLKCFICFLYALVPVSCQFIHYARTKFSRTIRFLWIVCAQKFTHQYTFVNVFNTHSNWCCGIVVCRNLDKLCQIWLYNSILDLWITFIW